jgi:uncharacterized protein (DUF924 family)
MTTPEEVLCFWFAADGTFRDVWFAKNAVFDRACAQFTDTVRAATRGALDHWAETPRGALALIIVLDQFSRNLFRDSPEAYAADERARTVARTATARGFDLAVTPTQRIFLYLPFEHSETLADQDESVRLFETLRGVLGDDSAKHAHSHRDVIRRFGRFPHRNAALGRISTSEEQAYLAEPGAGF